MSNRSKLVRISMRNIGCVGPEGLTISLDNIVCLVGKNNAGKSTVLRAYELAVGTQEFQVGSDRCHWAPEAEPSEIILEVHIPVGIANISEDWKQPEGDLLIVRSRWQWGPSDFKKTRTTWSPQAGDWATDGKAGGADPVFNSRLPRPMRIGSLDDANTSSDLLLTLALAPFTTQLKSLEATPGSPLMNSIEGIVKYVGDLTASHQQRFQDISDKVSLGFQGVFPRLSVRLDVNMSPPTFKLEDLVKRGSSIKVSEGSTETTLAQQGTGARRALFWSMLQVHNEMIREVELRNNTAKPLFDELKKLQKKAGNAETQAAIEAIQAQLKAIQEGAPLPDSPDDPAFPGYLLLIDEPENALHPMAARAAQRHLYKLADNPNWQVMMTTHSPYFINPLVNHMTITRLERSSNEEKAAISPRTYKSDTIEFGEEDKKNLQALQQMDSGLAEIFFGSYPVLVEGDTEHAAFLAAVIEENNELINDVAIIRSRGKAILTCLIKIMHHFKVSFGILHDVDPPYKKDGSINGMWTENEKIYAEVAKCRASGIDVRHRVSMPDFERALGGEELGKDKPFACYSRISKDDKLKVQFQSLLKDLISSTQMEPFEPTKIPYTEVLKQRVMAWAKENGLDTHPRFASKTKTSTPM